MLTKYELNFVETVNHDEVTKIHYFENACYQVSIVQHEGNKKLSTQVMAKEKYAPEIFVNTFKGELQVKIQTTAHGTLEIDEYDNYIEGVMFGKNTAIAIQELINNFNN